MPGQKDDKCLESKRKGMSPTLDVHDSEQETGGPDAECISAGLLAFMAPHKPLLLLRLSLRLMAYSSNVNGRELKGLLRNGASVS